MRLRRVPAALLLALLAAPVPGRVSAQTAPDQPVPAPPAPDPAKAPVVEIRPQDGCPEAEVQAMSLPHLKQAALGNQELVIVALGSSSTQGWMSSDVGHSYPAVLQQALARALPHTHVAVINRGIGGQDAAEEVPRLQTDALAVKPQLVIWQVGANGVLRDTDPAVFKRLVSAGLAVLQPHADVILMDNQRSPMIMSQPGHGAMDRALAELAATDRVNLFSRGALMDEWQTGGVPYARFVSKDGLHHNDLGYRCLGEALAATIAAGVKDPAKPVGVASGND